MPIPEVGVDVEQAALPEHINYPPNDGFQGETKQDYLMPGDVVDRFGEVGLDSRFLSTKSSSIEMRSLAPSTNTNIYNQYIVAKPIPVTSGTIAPGFNQPGGGLQFKTTIPINTLIQHNFLIKF